MVPPYEVIRTKVKPTLQNPAKIYVENWLTRNGCNSETFVGGAASFIACTFSAVREIPAAVPRYSTLSSTKKNLSGLSLRPQSAGNRVSNSMKVFQMDFI